MEENNIVENEILEELEEATEETAEETTEETKVVSPEEYEKKEKEAAEYLDKLQRTIAEFDNFRKRTVKEKASMYNDGVRDTIGEILPILDNFGRAFSCVKDKEDNFYKGVEMIFRQFEKVIEHIGVEKIETVGTSFDPNLHEAVMHVEDENYSENEIIEEIQKGYVYKDKVIRHSMVKVAN